MKYASLLTFSLIILSASVYADSNISHPEDIKAFIKKRDLCDHFRGEPAYDAERRDFLIKNMKEFCNGTDLELLNLKTKYKDNKNILQLLSAYEEDIEPNK